MFCFKFENLHKTNNFTSTICCRETFNLWHLHLKFIILLSSPLEELGLPSDLPPQSLLWKSLLSDFFPFHYLVRAASTWFSSYKLPCLATSLASSSVQSAHNLSYLGILERPVTLCTKESQESGRPHKIYVESSIRNCLTNVTQLISEL